MLNDKCFNDYQILTFNVAVCNNHYCVKALLKECTI